MSDGRLDKEIGQKIRVVRRMRGLSLQQVAKDIDMSYSYLSKLENGKHSASIVVLQRLANYFEVDLVYFFDNKESSAQIIKKEDMPHLELDDGISFGVVTSKDEKNMQVTLVHLPPNSPTERNIHKHEEGKELVVIMEGELNIVIDGNENILTEGDSILFDSTAEHFLYTTNKEAKFIMVVSPPYGRENPIG